MSTLDDARDDRLAPGLEADLYRLLDEILTDPGYALVPRTRPWPQVFADKTLRQVRAADPADGIPGLDWLQWALRPERVWNRAGSEHAAFGAALRAYCATIPELVRYV